MDTKQRNAQIEELSPLLRMLFYHATDKKVIIKIEPPLNIAH